MAGVVDLFFTPPPSVNGLWVYAGAGKRVRSKAYRQWAKAAGWEVKAQKPGHIAGPFKATITLPDSVKGDTDNYSKAALDLLTDLKVISDDRFCRGLNVERGGDRYRIVLTPIEGAAA